MAEEAPDKSTTKLSAEDLKATNELVVKINAGQLKGPFNDDEWYLLNAIGYQPPAHGTGEHRAA